MTNVEELFQRLVDLGQHPGFLTDTETVLERVGHFLDDAVQKSFDKFKQKGHENEEISQLIADDLDMTEVLRRSANGWDGGYTMGGIVGHGDSFVARDPSGIRPAFYYACDDFIVAASERPAIATTFNVDPKLIQEIPPANALVIKRNGQFKVAEFTAPKEQKSCTFERIYFSRGTDVDIYKERKDLGRFIVPKLLKSVGDDLQNTVFSFIPNTSLTAFLGMIKELEVHLSRQKAERIIAGNGALSPEEIRALITERIRIENVIVKDTKLRTFISDEANRKSMAEHVYDITYGSIRPNTDNLVCIDDSIVRGNTLQASILKILSRLSPKKLVIVSSAPQIRYPDCYGIDMSMLKELIAFRAAEALWIEKGQANVIEEIYEKCKSYRDQKILHTENLVKAFYEPFTEEQTSRKIADMLNIPELEGRFEIVYQSIDEMRRALPNSRGDWYFTGDYPTPGGNRVCNQAFINYFEKKSQRSY